MTNRKVLRGIELRYVLTWAIVLNDEPMTVAKLSYEVDRQGFAIAGRPSKAISDGLRWEVRYGRVRRISRGRYGPGHIPRGTEHRIWKRVMRLRAAARLSLEGGQFERYFGAEANETGVA